LSSGFKNIFYFQSFEEVQLTHFHYTEWPGGEEDTVPSSTHGLLGLTEHALAHQEQASLTGPIAVHCRLVDSLSFALLCNGINVLYTLIVYCIPCILYCVPCILYCVPCIVYGVPCIVYCVPCIVYCVPCILYCVPCILYCVPCIVYGVTCIVYCVPCIVYGVPCIVYCVPCIVYRVPCILYCLP